jgi:hypothetical protein
VGGLGGASGATVPGAPRARKGALRSGSHTGSCHDSRLRASAFGRGALPVSCPESGPIAPEGEQLALRPVCPLPHPIRQLLVFPHDRCWSSPDFAMTQELQDFAPTALAPRWPRLVSVRGENRLRFAACRRLERAPDPVRRSPEAEVSGSVCPALGITFQASSGSEPCVELARRKTQRRTFYSQGVKAALSSGE